MILKDLPINGGMELEINGNFVKWIVEVYLQYGRECLDSVELTVLDLVQSGF